MPDMTSRYISALFDRQKQIETVALWLYNLRQERMRLTLELD